MASAQLQKIDGGQLQVSGELSMSTVPALLQEHCLQAMADDVVIDLQHVERADSAGVALLIEWQRVTQRQKKKLRFQNTPSQMLAIARLSGVDELLALS